MARLRLLENLPYKKFSRTPLGLNKGLGGGVLNYDTGPTRYKIIRPDLLDTFITSSRKAIKVDVSYSP